MTLAVRESNPIAQLDRELILDVIADKRSENTRRVYESLFRNFSEWASLRGFLDLPAEPAIVSQYLIDRALNQGCTLGTLQTNAAAISAMHSDFDFPDPMKHPRVKDTMKGLSRRIGKPQKQAAGLTREVQIAINATAHIPRYQVGRKVESKEVATARGIGDVAIVAVMRDALLRRSEAAALTWEDIETEADGSGRLTVRKSKTDQTSKGTILYLSPETMKALEALRQTKPYHSGPTDSVFMLSAHQISRRITAAARAAGFDGNFSGHSPRVGMATDLSAAGCELPELMTAGRWDTPGMPARYTRNQAAGKGAVAKYYNR